MLSPKEVVNKWVDAFNASDVDMIVSLYDNNATNYQVANEPVVGVVAIREMFANEFSTAKMVYLHNFSLAFKRFRFIKLT